MEWEDVFPWFTLAILGALGLAVKSSREARALRGGFETLTDRVGRLDALVQRLQTAPPAPTVEAEPAAPSAAAAESIPAAAVEAPTEAATPEVVPAPTPAGSGNQWEQVLAENWLVWLGGLALALGGGFLVKLSIDYGLLIPGVRVALGVLLGIGLALGADWVARREPAAGYEETTPSYVPQALAAAGAATVFASLYAAYQLYDLLPASLALPLLAGTAAATVVMSLRHGPFVAALGLVGAYLVPLLVRTDTAAALPLFGYLTLVTAASLALLRHRAWWWLAWLSLGSAVFWVLLWLGSAGDQPETPVVGGYLLLQLALFGAFRRGVDQVAFLAGIADALMVRILTRSAFWVFAATIAVLAHVDGFGEASLVAALLGAIFLLWFGYRDPGVDDVIAAAGVLLLALLATWDLPFLGDLSEYAERPVEVTDFVTASVICALLLGGGGYLMLAKVPRPGRWAALSAAAPILVLVIGYLRLRGFALDIGWSGIALALAGLQLAAAAAVARRRTGEREIEIALAAYAVAVLGATILAATFALSEAWLTVALGLHLPAIGWVEGRIRLPVLRWLALGVAGIVLIRLMLNPWVLDYPLSATPIFNWLLYGYGVPAVAFIVATRQFGSRADDPLVGVLEAGSIAFSTMLLTLELRHALYGRLDTPFSDLGRDATQTLLWLALSVPLLRIGERRGRPVLSWGGVILFALATVKPCCGKPASPTRWRPTSRSGRW
jgi:uncharacterized membrane protein